ncbi:putative Histidine kinase [uncultured Desulfobacterium sp.]|uniref:histidine kinase n=1 Tax=uncultured Desulfobacterium sp. TaxID=201089 RepID=A0A445MZD2_9BACT|nr:putative Histidine kinase [uncultured Desulfobacterium sp.]
MAKILIVDDEEEIRKAYGLLVSGMGYEVFMAKDSEEAKSVLLSEKDFDVALIDRVLPGEEDGMAILELLRISQPLCQNVLVSGYPTFDSASEALRLSAFDYLTKPVQKDQLSRVIREAVKEKRRQEEVQDSEKSRKDYEQLKTKQDMLQHDMRSLLLGITGFCNLLVSRTLLDETQMEYMRQIQQCTLQLEAMVNTYLDINNLEKESFHIEKSSFDILEVLRQSRKALRFLADEKNVDISLMFDRKVVAKNDVLYFEGNRMFLQNAINNILKNAIEASPQDQKVEIKITNSENAILIGVHNWGTVPKEIRTKFFEKYSSSGKKGGLGLGTYMADLVVKAHNGQISIETSEQMGTDVLIMLPFPKKQGLNRKGKL